MNKFKRILTGLCAIVFCGTFTACSEKPHTTDGNLTVVATNFALYDFARTVCGDSCDVRMLISPGSESHDFEATLKDIALLAETDVFVYVGGESEEWVPDILEAAGASDVVQVRAIDLVETYVSAGTESGHEHSEGDGHHHETDEHIWTSIPNAITIMDAIQQGIQRVSEGFEFDWDGRNAYISELLDIDADIRRTVEASTQDTLIFADRFPFRYFTEEYGLNYCAAFDGCSSAVEPSLSTINTIIERVNGTGSSAVFTIEFSDRKTAEAVASETGCEILEFHSAHNVSKADFESGITYADIMRKNAENLKIALNVN
ncbi:MAG: zinc ABC transporter substrate-binding protein [Clostridia bacterium]|nr:zinc ABC transporter substrate-binding protein [Clostridia bacterium]